MVRLAVHVLDPREEALFYSIFAGMVRGHMTFPDLLFMLSSVSTEMYSHRIGELNRI